MLAGRSAGGRPQRAPTPTEDTVQAAVGLLDLAGQGQAEPQAATPTGEAAAEEPVVVQDEFGGWGLAETTKVKHVDAGMLPQKLWFDEQGECYNERSSVITQRYKGIDAPSRERASSGRFFEDETPVFITCQDTGKASPPTASFGGKLKEAVSTAPVTMFWHTNSQHPAMILRIQRDDDKRDVLVHIFTDSLRRVVIDTGNDTELACHLGADKAGQELLRNLGSEDAKGHARKGDIVTWAFQLWDMYSKEDAPAGTPPAKAPIVSNLDDTELAAWTKKYYGPKPTETLKPWQLLVCALAKEQTRFTVSRYWAAADMEIARKFWAWMLTAVDMVAHHGSHWAYQLQDSMEGKAIYNPTTLVKGLECPRWIIQQWRVLCESDGTIVKKLGPAQCSGLAIHSYYPDSGMFPFELKIGIERERQHQSLILSSLLSDRKPWSIKATIMADIAQTNIYVVSLAAAVEPELLPADKSARPQAGARIEITLKTADGAKNKGKTYKLEGMLCENLFDLPGELCCFVRCNTSLQDDIETLKLAGNHVETQCNAKFVDDPTPADRYAAGVSELQDALEPGEHVRTKGIDSPAIFLRSLPAIAPGLRGSFAQELASSLVGRGAFDAVLKWRALNQKQLEAAHNSRDSENGLTVVQGPPGTGKSWMAMSTVEAHVRAGKAMGKKRQTLVCAPSNDAVDVCVDQFLKGMVKGSEKLICVRFTSGLAKPQATAKQQDQEMADAGTSVDEIRRQTAFTARSSTENDKAKAMELAELDAAYWEHVTSKAKFMNNERHAVLGYHAARTAWENTVLERPNHTMREKVMEYRELLAETKKVGLSRKAAGKARAALQDAAEPLDEYYLGNVVDVVFATSSTSAFPTLRSYYKPRFLLIDEAAITTMADPLTPIAVFVNETEHVMLVGDHMQQGPLATADKVNEYSAAYTLSLFELAFNDKHLESSRVVLTVQHRMHPEISDLVSNVFYTDIDGGLKNHESVIGQHPKWITMQAFLQRMGPAYNNTHRLLVDVSGLEQDERADDPKAKHIGAVQEASSTSWRNPHEANVIARFIIAACAMPPPTGGQAIEPKDFLAISHYGDQCEEISQHLKQLAVGRGFTSKARVMTVRAVQGEEGLFVMFSATRTHYDDPRNLGFTTHKEGLNVAMSRAKQGLFCFGNYAQLIKHMVSGAPWINANKAAAKAQNVGKILAYGKSHRELVSWLDLEAALDTEVPTPKAPTITQLIQPDEGLRKKYSRNETARENANKKRSAPTVFDQLEQAARANAASSSKLEAQRLQPTNKPAEASKAAGESSKAAGEGSDEPPKKKSRRRKRGKKGGKGKEPVVEDEEGDEAPLGQEDEAMENGGAA